MSKRIAFAIAGLAVLAVVGFFWLSNPSSQGLKMKASEPAPMAQSSQPKAQAPEEPIPEVDALTLSVRLKSAEPPFLLDVREPLEYESLSIEGAKLVPLGQLENRIYEVPQDRPVVVYCRSGNRSAQAVRILREHGFTNVENLTGGIKSWVTVSDCNPDKKVC